MKAPDLLQPIDGTEPYLSAHSGLKVRLLNPQPDDISIQDIAWGLSRQNRFNGHTSHPYTVAQHCVFVSYLVPPELALQALLHDAAEAYLGDLPYPVKKLCPDYQQIEDRLQRAIMRHFGVPEELPPEIKRADLIALATEKRDLMPQAKDEQWEVLEGVTPDPSSVNYCPPSQARKLFRFRYAQLTSGAVSHE